MRRLLPTWLRDVRRVLWLTKEFESSTLNRVRFALALVAHRLTRRPASVRMSLGVGRPPLKLRPFQSDLEVALSLFRHGEYAPVQQMFGKIETIIDLGSNIGGSIRLWSDWFDGATIIGVEPDPDSYEIARSNVMLGCNSNVRLLRGAVCAHHGPLTLRREGEPWGFQVTADNPAGGIPVESLTMPELIEMLPARHADFLKCDIEGGEAELFAHCAGWIGRVSNVAIETHAPYTLTAFERDVAANGGQLSRLASHQPNADHSVGFYRVASTT